MAAKVAGNVNCDQEISSRPQGQQAANNTMDNTGPDFRPSSRNNSGGEGANGPSENQGTGMNSAMSSAGQPPGNTGTEIGTKTASSVGSGMPGSNSSILQQDGHHGGQSGMSSGHHPSQNQSLDPYAGPGGTYQSNSSMHSQLMDNTGQKCAQNMTGSEGYNGGYYGNRNAGYGMTNQHGGHQTGNAPPNSTLNMNIGPNQNQNMTNNPYNQYDGHMGSRQGYSPMVVGSRSGPNVPPMPPSYGSSQQQQQQQQSRPYGGDRISNSAPTLSQLLQGQKHVPNYSSSYPSPGDNMVKGSDGGASLGMMANQGSGTFHQSPQNWGQRSTNMSHSQVHPQSTSGSGYGPNMGRNQMGGVVEGGPNPVLKRPFPGLPYQQQGQLGTGSRQYPGMSQPMYPGSHMAGSRSHNTQTQGGMPNMAANTPQYPQQMPSQYGQQGQGMEYNQQQSWQQSWQQQPPSWQQHQQGMPPYSTSQQQSQQHMWSNAQPSSQQQPLSSSSYQQPQQPTSTYSRGGQQTTPSNNKSGNPPDEVSVSNRPPSLPDLSGSLDDLPTGADFSQNNVPASSQSTDSYSQSSQSPHMHPTVSALRPSPSPVGSPASHMSRSSLSPASVPGGSLTPQPTSMPPPSSQSETSSHNQISQSPMGQQDRGFSQPMMPGAAPMGSNQMPPPYGSQSTPKSHHGQQQSTHPQNSPGGPQMYPGMGAGYSGGMPVGYGPNMGQYNQQGNFQRQGGMQGFGGPHSNFPSHSTGNGGSSMYIDGRMRSTSSSSSVSSMDGFSNSQYPGYNSGSMPNTSTPGMSPSHGAAGVNSTGIKSPGLGPGSYGYNHPHRTDLPGMGPASINTSGGSSGMGSPGLITGAPGMPGAASEANMTGGSTSPGMSNPSPGSLGPGNKGAQAAAEAAVIAAANMASAKSAYHRTLGSQHQGRQQPQQPFPPPYQQHQPQHWPQVPPNQGYPNSACPVPSSVPASMPNSLGSPMPPSSMVNSMPNSMPNSMFASAPASVPNSMPSANAPGSMPPFSHGNSQRNHSFMSTDATGQVTTTLANSLPGSMGTSVTPSITAPVCMPSVTTSGVGTMPNMLDTPKNSPAMSKDDTRADTPQSQKNVKSETASRPSSPPLGLLGASPLGSPGAISKSSQEESAPSPSPSLLNKLPASPANKPPKRSTSTKPSVHEQLMKLYDLCDHPDRKPFLDAVFRLMEDRGQPIRTMPQISTHTLDLFKLYHAVKERGGVVKVSKNKQWKQIAMYLTVGSSNSAAFTLKKNYIRYLLPFECFHDRGGVDPQVIMAEIDTSKKKSSSSSSSSSSDAAHHHAAPNPMLDNMTGASPQDYHGGPRDMYQQRPHPGGKPMNQMHPFPQPMHNNMVRGMSPMPNNMMPMPNDSTSNSVTVRDPFSDADFQSSGNSQGPRPGQGPFPPGMAQNSVDGAYGSGMNQYRSNPMGAGGDAFNTMGSLPPNSAHTTGEPFAGGMRNNAMPGSDPFTSARRDGMAVPDGFNRRTNMPVAEPFPVNNRAGGMGMNQAGSTQYPYGTPYDRERFDQQRSRVSASPSQPAQQGTPSIIPPYPNNSMDQNMYSSRFSQQHTGSRPATPSDSFGQTSLPNQQKPPHASGLPTEQLRQQFPQKRPGDMYGPASKRPDMMTPAPPMSRPDDTFRGVPPYGQQGPYPQGAYPGGDRPMGSQGAFTPGYREGRPHQGPTPVPQQSGKHELGGSGGGFVSETYGMRDRSIPGSGPSPSWGTMQQRQPAPPYTNSSLGPHPFVSQAGPPRTLQQALMAAHRDRHPPSKLMKTSPPQIHTTSPQKKEIVFPPDSVEATQPALTKPKKKSSRDIGTVEAWKLMMALKSGLLAESTWALEVLNILLYDNSTIVYFDLSQLKGLLEILVDHFRASLIKVFGTLVDVEVRTCRKGVAHANKDFPQDCDCVCRKRLEDTQKCHHDKSEERLIQEALNLLDIEKLKGADKKRSIRLEHNTDGFYSSEKDWDYHEGFKSNQLHWQFGGGDMTKHIVHVFESDGILKNIIKRQAQRRKAERARIVREFKKAKRMKEQNHQDGEGEENIQSKDDMEETEELTKEEEIAVKGEEEAEEEVEEEEDVSIEEEAVEETENDIQEDMWIESCSEELCAAKKQSDVIALYKTDSAPPPTMSLLEDEGTCNDHTALVTSTDAQHSLAQRCITISNIIRSLSFIPGNDVELSKHAGVLVVLGRILLLHHKHAERKQLPQTYDREDHDDLDMDCPITDKNTWWWHCLNCLRENALVTLTNISGQLDLSLFVERVSLPILDGLLHWAVCLSACAMDPFPTLPATSPLTPKRIAIEALSKLSIQANNVDMILATPPFHRLEKLFATLTQYLSDRKEPVMREFAIVLLSSIAQDDPTVSRAIASQNSCISFLLCYLEDSEYAKSLESGSNAKQLSQNPDIQPASPDMMRRTAILLAALAKVSDNRALFLQHQHRLLNLSMSPMVTDAVKVLIADALFEISTS